MRVLGHIAKIWYWEVVVVFVVWVDNNMTIFPLERIFYGVDMDAPLKLKGVGCGCDCSMRIMMVVWRKWFCGIWMQKMGRL